MKSSKIVKFIVIILIIIIVFILSYQGLNKVVDLAELKIYIDKIYKILTYSVPLSKTMSLSFLSIMSFTFIIFIWMSVARLYKKFIYWLRAKKKHISSGTITILANIWYYAIVTIVLLTSLKTIWIDLSSFTMIISALSVWIWFWLQTIVSNFISGIILMFEQSIKEWDYIEIGTDLRGTVKSINMRSTTIKTNSNIDVVVPNQSFIQNNIINWTHADNMVKLQIPFGVAYGTKFELVEQVLLWSLEKSELKYIKNDMVRKPAVIMTGMWASSVDFFLSIWIEWDETNSPTVAKWKYLRLIYETLNDNNISIPFPQTDLHIKDAIPLEINIHNK